MMTKVCTSLFKGSIPNLINFLQVQFSGLQRKRGERTNEGWSSTTMASSCSNSATCLREARQTNTMISYRFAFGTAGVVVLSAKPVSSMITLVLLIHLQPLRAQSSKEKAHFLNSESVRSSSLKKMRIYAWTVIQLSPSEVFVMQNSMNLNAYIQ